MRTGRRKLAAEVWLTEKLISISPVAKFWSYPARHPACIEMENYNGGSHVAAVREYAWLEEGNMGEWLCPFETLKSAYRRILEKNNSSLKYHDNDE